MRTLPIQIGSTSRDQDELVSELIAAHERQTIVIEFVRHANATFEVITVVDLKAGGFAMFRCLHSL